MKYEKRNKINNRINGITLIALVITILVLLILAGVSIAILGGDNGIIARARRAKEQTQNAEQDENETLGNYNELINSYVTIAANNDSTQVNVSDLIKGVVDVIYPIGSIYMTLDEKSPDQILGGVGKWEKIEDTMLIGAGNNYAVGSTGGNTSVTLTSGNIPSITAKTSATSATTSSSGAHTHTVNIRGAGYSGWTGTLSGWPYYALTYKDTAFANMAAEAINKYVGSCNFGDTSSSGAHTHTVSIPALNANYTNNSQSAVNIQNPYTAVYIWKRVE